MKHSLKIFCLVFIFFSSACSVTELEENLDNPNDVTEASLDINLLMNKAQADFGDFVALSNVPSMELSRMACLIGGDAYNVAYQPQDHNDIWERGYQDVLVQIETLLGRTDGTGFTVHSGTARILKAYVLLTLVDLFGDVPYSQALKGASGPDNFNPANDSGQSIYTAAITMLDEAIALLAAAPVAPATSLTRDIYYGGNRARWTALANTLKLKAYMNLRLTDAAGSKAKIEALLSADLIDTDAEEFTYKYSSADVPSRSRHPLYRQMYQPILANASGYINNHFLHMAYKQKGVEDPRWRYYFYRQIGSILAALNDEPESIPCVISPKPSHYSADNAWCAFDPGFYGRDHGNADGIPPDGGYLTCYGVYPAGGKADTNLDDPDFLGYSQQGQGANGAGIEPIWMASFTEFLKAEAALTLNVAGGDAAASLTSGVTKSIARVRGFAASKNQGLPAGLEAPEADYLNTVNTLYTNAATPDDKLAVLAREYYLALWGNGIEAYNLYRRTGKPAGMQPMRNANPGSFIRSLLYPADFVNLNSSVPQKPTPGVTITKVFWDNNPDNFVY